MFPGVYGFQWTAGHLIFLGVFYAVLAVVIVTASLALGRAIRDFRRGAVETICWQAEFHDLPREARACRHDIDGRRKGRVCERGFDCTRCETHERLAAAAPPHLGPEPADVLGFPLPLDRLYHRGHTWLRLEADGTATVGLDELGRRLAGAIDDVELPAAGTAIRANGVAGRLRRGKAFLRLLAPVDGTVIETGDATTDWWLRLHPLNGKWETAHLLAGAEAQAWMSRELERLQLVVSGPAGPSLADGGVLIDNALRDYPDDDWETVCAHLFLQPS